MNELHLFRVDFSVALVRLRLIVLSLGLLAKPWRRSTNGYLAIPWQPNPRAART